MLTSISKDIDKTYNILPPRPRRTTNEIGRLTSSDDSPRSMSPTSNNGILSSVMVDDNVPPKTRSLVSKPGLFCQAHLATFILLSYMLLLTALSQNTGLTKSLFLLHAVAWRIWHTAGIGSILVSQSKSKGWIRHFVRVGEGRLEAWREWQGIYHISLIGCWASFFMAGWKYYKLPEFWGYGSGFALLAHTIGIVS